MNDADGPTAPQPGATLDAVRAWCAADDIDVVIDGFGTGARLRCDTVELEVDASGDDVVVRHRFGIQQGVFEWAIPGAPTATPTVAEVVGRVVDSRWGPVRGRVEVADAGSRITVECACDRSDLTRAWFRAATSELVKTRRVIDRLIADDVAQRAALAAVSDAAATPAPAAGGWVPTHVVPPGGAETWSEPHPEAPATERLDAGQPVRVDERRGEWARVVRDDGRSAWVDGRVLQPLR